MFEPDSGAFPSNIILALKPHIQALDPDVTILTRPINRSDPVQCFAIFASGWVPDDDSNELRGIGGFTGPTINRYTVAIQSFNQDMDEERGLAVQARMATAVRMKLSRDMDVRVALGALQSSAFDCTERFMRSVFQQQRYLNNEIEGQFLFLSSTELLIETEVS